MRKDVLITLLGAALINGCATQPGRFAVGAALGGVAGGASGAALSPNEESRGLNALIFGLSGAIAGGVIGILSGKTNVDQSVSHESLRTKELGVVAKPLNKEFVLPAQEELPKFIRDRFKPVVIEEYIERDTLSEDGSLHEPHKVYRIKRPAELIADPGAAQAEQAVEVNR